MNEFLFNLVLTFFNFIFAFPKAEGNPLQKCKEEAYGNSDAPKNEYFLYEICYFIMVYNKRSKVSSD